MPVGVSKELLDALGAALLEAVKDAVGETRALAVELTHAKREGDIVSVLQTLKDTVGDVEENAVHD